MVFTALEKTMPNIATSPYRAENYEGNITLKASLYAIACIQSLPEDRQERSDMIEMCALARRTPHRHLANMLRSVEHHVGGVIDLLPAHGGSEANGCYSNGELDLMEAVRKLVKEQDDQFKRSLALVGAPASNVVGSIDGVDDQEEEPE
jgi:hypothetical protein